MPRCTPAARLLLLDTLPTLTTYAYDALGQMSRVDDSHENATWVYCYEDSGSTYIRSLRTTDTLGTVVQRMVNLV